MKLETQMGPHPTGPWEPSQRSELRPKDKDKPVTRLGNDMV